MWAPGTYLPDRGEGEAVHANIGVEKYFFEAGDRIPADGRVIHAVNLEVEEAALTGENIPTAKTTSPQTGDVMLADRSSMAYMHTTVTRGRGSRHGFGVGRPVRNDGPTLILSDGQSPCRELVILTLHNATQPVPVAIRADRAKVALAAPAIIDSVAVADVELRLGAEAPNGVLDEPREPSRK
jgi:hypothetical protein